LTDTRDKTVYAIQCRNTKRLYIGCTADVETRIRTHFSELQRGLKTKSNGKGKRINSPWQEDFICYGVDNFDVFIIEENIAADKSQERESYYICLYGTTDEKRGYNTRGVPRQPLRLIRGMPSHSF